MYSVVSGFQTWIACPNYEVVRVLHPELQPHTEANSSLKSGFLHSLFRQLKEMISIEHELDTIQMLHMDTNGGQTSEVT